MSYSIILDLIVVGIFVLCVIAGMKKGLVKSIYRIFAFVLAIILSIVLLQPFTRFLSQTSIAESVRASITQSIENTGGTAVTELDEMLTNLHLPVFLKDDISNQYREQTQADIQESEAELNGIQSDEAELNETQPQTSIAEWTANVLTDKIIGVLGAIILFIAIRILLSLIFHMLDELFKLPVLKSVNRVLGALLGMLNGAIIVYGLCAVLTLLAANDAMASLMKAIEGSLVTRCFYEYNVLLNLLTINHSTINHV